MIKNDANQITTKNNIDYIYDADGNLLQDEHYKYEYNAFGYQTKVTDLQGQEVARYEYDDTGLRTKKIIGSKTYEYYYDGNQLSLEIIRNGDSIVQYRNYQWDGNTPLGMVIREKDQSGAWIEKIYHFWTNHRGDVVLIQDNEGIEVGSYTYDSYGNVLTEVGEVANNNPIRYAGYYYDKETKNYYLQARYYNPENGSFLALDPHPGDLKEPISQNGYNYANNNPVIYFDPTGYLSWKTRKMSYGKRYELHLSNKEAKNTIKVLTNASEYAGGAIGALAKGPWYVRVAAATAGVWSTNQLKKLGKKIKEENKGNGVFIIYGASYSSSKWKEKEKDFSTAYAVRSR